MKNENRMIVEELEEWKRRYQKLEQKYGEA